MWLNTTNCIVSTSGHVQAGVIRGVGRHNTTDGGRLHGHTGQGLQTVRTCSVYKVSEASYFHISFAIGMNLT